MPFIKITSPNARKAAPHGQFPVGYEVGLVYEEAPDVIRAFVQRGWGVEVFISQTTTIEEVISDTPFTDGVDIDGPTETPAPPAAAQQASPPPPQPTAAPPAPAPIPAPAQARVPAPASPAPPAGPGPQVGTGTRTTRKFVKKEVVS